jgi:hypothetical protein
MARKTLLTEAEIRQFMKLANLGPLATPKLNEMGYGAVDLDERDEEEELEAELGATEDELGAEDQFADEEGDEIDALDDIDAELGADEGPVGEADVEELVQALADTIQQVTGVDIAVEGGAEEAPVDDIEAVDDVAVDEIPLDGGEEEIAVDSEEEIEELPGNRDLYNENDIVNEVARRVVARLNATQRQENLTDALAERIMQRLTKTK